MGKVKLLKCQYCGKYPRRLTVMNEHKYMCCWENPLGKQGDWNKTKNAARRAWNIRSSGNIY